MFKCIVKILYACNRTYFVSLYNTYKINIQDIDYNIWYHRIYKI